MAQLIFAVPLKRPQKRAVREGADDEARHRNGANPVEQRRGKGKRAGNGVLPDRGEGIDKQSTQVPPQIRLGTLKRNGCKKETVGKGWKVEIPLDEKPKEELRGGVLATPSPGLSKQSNQKIQD